MNNGDVYFQHEEQPINIKPNEEATKDFSSLKSIGSILLYSAIGVGITAIITFGIGYLFRYLFETATEANQNSLMIGYLVTMIISFIGLLIIPFVINFIAKKKAVKIWVPYILYSICFGLVLSCFAFLLQPMVLGGAFLISALAFFVMGIIGYFAKGNLRLLHIVLIGLGVAILLGAVSSLIIGFFVENETLRWIYIIVSVAILLYSMIIVIIDVNRIKNLANTYQNHANLVFYAYVFYADYVFILLRILQIAVLILGKKK